MVISIKMQCLRALLPIVVSTLCFGILPYSVHAFEFSGRKVISAVDGNGDEIVLGELIFVNSNEKGSYTINWDDELFTDHFLSMRPFECLEGPVKYWCRVVYPYPIRRHLSENDLVDLEYDLLFIWKGATEYGIKMWNGVYYKLGVVGDALVGNIHEMDMDRLSAPPEVGDYRPIRERDLEPGEPSSHWLPKVIIR